MDNNNSNNNNMIQLTQESEVVSISQWKDITKSYKFEMRPTRNQEIKSK